jgi:hypothetical protein
MATIIRAQAGLTPSQHDIESIEHASDSIPGKQYLSHTEVRYNNGRRSNNWKEHSRSRKAFGRHEKLNALGSSLSNVEIF